MSQPRKVLLVSHAGRKSNIETAAGGGTEE